MTVPPLCIIQARFHSRRLPGKMLLPLRGETLLARGWRIAVEAFGADHCIVAIPAKDMDGPLGVELHRISARVAAYDGHEADVLGRFHSVAHTFRWLPESVIVRYTPDDPFKVPELMYRVVNGERLPVEQGAEAFTLAMLDRAHRTTGEFDNERREHLTHALFPDSPPPVAPSGQVWTIDTQADYDAACAQLSPNTAPKPPRAKREPREKAMV